MAQQTQPEVIPPEHYQADDEEGHMSTDIGALTQLNAAEINQQIMTARAYPRSMTSFRKQMREMTTLDEDVAQSCLYALQRGRGTDKKTIEGPSARFAEVAMQCWGNARAGSRIIDIGEEYITAQGFFYDLEKNMAVSYEVLRRITGSDGKRYGADMIGVTGNAACSIAIRNAILKGIPKAFWNDAYQAARHVAFGKGETLANKRVIAIKAFAIYGIEPPQIYGILGVKGAEDITLDHLVFLGGLHTAIKEGDTTPEEAFSAEKMANPGEIAPRRPQQSEFERKPQAEKEGDKPAAEKATEKSADQKQGQPVVDEAAERAARLHDDMATFLDQKLLELPSIEKVRDLGEWREDMLDELKGFADLIEKMNAAADVRNKEITTSKLTAKKK